MKIAKVLDRCAGTCYNDLTSVKEGFFVVLLHARLFLRREAPVWRGRYGGYAADGRMPEKQTGGADMRVKITLACSECKQRNYETKKNKKNDPDRLEMNKYCRFCNKHTLHRETK